MTSRAAPTNVISKQLTFCYRIALKENREALLVLRHQGRLPSATTSLIQKIGEGILVLPRMSRELDHYSLVFFHRGLNYEPVNIYSAGAGRSGPE